VSENRQGDFGRHSSKKLRFIIALGAVSHAALADGVYIVSALLMPSPNLRRIPFLVLFVSLLSVARAFKVLCASPVYVLYFWKPKSAACVVHIQQHNTRHRQNYSVVRNLNVMMSECEATIYCDLHHHVCEAQNIILTP
jgi:hypothetical protein